MIDTTVITPHALAHENDKGVLGGERGGGRHVGAAAFESILNYARLKCDSTRLR